MLKAATNDLGKGHVMLPRDALRVPVKLIRELNLRPNHTSNLHLHLLDINFLAPDDGDGVYDHCYGWRDSESLDNTLGRIPYGGPMITYTTARQLTVILGFALGRNAIAAYLHRQRHPGGRAA